MNSVKERVYSDLAIPPGGFLAEELSARGMTQKELADRTGRPEQKISEIINGKKAITHDTALELEKVLGLPADFWVNMEASYQLTRARQRDKAELEKQEDWIDFFPIREMKDRGHVPDTRDKQKVLAAILQFFGVASFATLRHRLDKLVKAHEYRITAKSKLSEGALWVWLREGSLAARDMETKPYNEQRFRAALADIRALTTEEPSVFFPKMRGLCANAGVAFVVIKEFPKSGANGVTRWLAADKAMIQVSTKWKWMDIFWFSFFHEAKHVLDRDKRRAFINGINVDPDVEDGADRFAADTLIPRARWENFVSTPEAGGRLSVQEFAGNIGVHPGIVVGRLLHEEGFIQHRNLNDLRPRFHWPED